MKFIAPTQSVSVRLTEKEETMIRETRDCLAELFGYMEENAFFNIHCDYGGEYEIDELGACLNFLDEIVDIKSIS